MSCAGKLRNHCVQECARCWEAVINLPFLVANKTNKFPYTTSKPSFPSPHQKQKQARADNVAPWRLTSDAALTGTDAPGLGGFACTVHGGVCRTAARLRGRRANPGLPIVVLELVAAAVNLIKFRPEAPLSDVRGDGSRPALSAQLALRSGRAHSAGRAADPPSRVVRTKK